MNVTKIFLRSFFLHPNASQSSIFIAKIKFCFGIFTQFVCLKKVCVEKQYWFVFIEEKLLFKKMLRVQGEENEKTVSNNILNIEQE